MHVQHAAEAVGLMEAVYWLVASVGDAIGGSSALMVWLGYAVRTESKSSDIAESGMTAHYGRGSALSSKIQKCETRYLLIRGRGKCLAIHTK